VPQILAKATSRLRFLFVREFVVLDSHTVGEVAEVFLLALQAAFDEEPILFSAIAPNVAPKPSEFFSEYSLT